MIENKIDTPLVDKSDEPLCMCKDRALSDCPGEWEPGCDLGNNAKYVRVVQPEK
jgi:hypothetical protein